MTRRLLISAATAQVVSFAILTPFAGFVVTPAAAESTDYWRDSYQPAFVVRSPPAARPAVLPKGAHKAEKIAAEGSKPVGPLVIAISIQRQQVKVYDSRGLFAESPISSGMPGHSTPMGVFSIIQKSKYHRSNIYSGAPMPYMQRITWSGVAMHAGVLPGYPASHGCIRMPMSFAMKMWGWTRMGARVIVTPGEVSPADVSHPVLDALAPAVPVAAAPASVNIKTADASGIMSGYAQRTMADIATGSISSALDVAADVADNGMPPVPAPAPVDLSDVAPPAPDISVAAEAPAADTGKARAETSIDSAASASVTPDAAPPIVAPVAVIAPAPEARDPVPVTAAPLIKRNSPVAIFVSRRDARLYIRQNFAPVLDMPIEIAPGAHPLGTHVFTARPGADDDKKLRWTVVSMPAVARQASAAPNNAGRSRRPAAVEVAQLAPATANEALSRLNIPADLMTRLGEALPSGSSLVVSDQAIAQGETGEGTDFILRLR